MTPETIAKILAKQDKNMKAIVNYTTNNGTIPAQVETKSLNKLGEITSILEEANIDFNLDFQASPTRQIKGDR